MKDDQVGENRGEGDTKEMKKKREMMENASESGSINQDIQENQCSLKSDWKMLQTAGLCLEL